MLLKESRGCRVPSASTAEGSSNESSANIPPADATRGICNDANDRSTAASSNAVGSCASAAAGTTTRVPHFGQGRVLPAQRLGTWSRARQPVQRNPIGMDAYPIRWPRRGTLRGRVSCSCYWSARGLSDRSGRSGLLVPASSVMIPLAVAVAASARNQAAPMTSPTRPQAAAPDSSPREESRAPSPSTTAITIGSRSVNNTPHARSRRMSSRMEVLACESVTNTSGPNRWRAVCRQSGACCSRRCFPALSARHVDAVKQSRSLGPTASER
jgi:hypothetical protein